MQSYVWTVHVRNATFCILHQNSSKIIFNKKNNKDDVVSYREIVLFLEKTPLKERIALKDIPAI